MKLKHLIKTIDRYCESYSHKPHLADLPGDHRIKDETILKQRQKELIKRINKEENQLTKKDYFKWELQDYKETTSKALTETIKKLEQTTNNPQEKQVLENNKKYYEKRLALLDKDIKELEHKENIIKDYYEDYDKTIKDLKINNSKKETELYTGSTKDSFRLCDGNNIVAHNEDGTYSLFRKENSHGGYILYNQYENKDGVFHKLKVKGLNDGYLGIKDAYDEPIHEIKHYNYDDESTESYVDHKVFITQGTGKVYTESSIMGMGWGKQEITHTYNTPLSDKYILLPDNTLRPALKSDGVENMNPKYYAFYDGSTLWDKKNVKKTQQVYVFEDV